MSIHLFYLAPVLTKFGPPSDTDAKDMELPNCADLWLDSANCPDSLASGCLLSREGMYDVSALPNWSWLVV